MKYPKISAASAIMNDVIVGWFKKFMEFRKFIEITRLIGVKLLMSRIIMNYFLQKSNGQSRSAGPLSVIIQILSKLSQ